MKTYTVDQKVVIRDNPGRVNSVFVVATVVKVSSRTIVVKEDKTRRERRFTLRGKEWGYSDTWHGPYIVEGMTPQQAEEKNKEIKDQRFVKDRIAEIVDTLQRAYLTREDVISLHDFVNEMLKNKDSAQ